MQTQGNMQVGGGGDSHIHVKRSTGLEVNCFVQEPGGNHGKKFVIIS